MTLGRVRPRPRRRLADRLLPTRERGVKKRTPGTCGYRCWGAELTRARNSSHELFSCKANYYEALMELDMRQEQVVLMLASNANPSASVKDRHLEQPSQAALFLLLKERRFPV